MIVKQSNTSYDGVMAAKKQVAKAPVAEPDHRFVLRLPPELHRSLRHVAIDRGTSLNKLIAEVLEEWWAKQPERKRYSKPPRD